MHQGARVAAVVALTWVCGCSNAPVHAALIHRPDDSQCSEPAAAGNCGCASCGGDPNCCPEPPFECTADSNCTQGVNGRCSGTGPVAGCACTYDLCSGDSDCPSNQTCACHDSPYWNAGSQCFPGNCRVDSDCGPGGECSPSYDLTLVGFYCHTPQDDCVNDADCPAQIDCSSGPMAGGPKCVYFDSAGRWQCKCVPIPL
jgi:hypothetical protein